MKRSKEERNAYYRKWYNDNIEVQRAVALKNYRARLEKRAPRPRPEACELCDTVGKVVWDHDHDTGVFRGWLCHRCNLLLGTVEKNIPLISKMIKYAVRHLDGNIQ